MRIYKVTYINHAGDKPVTYTRSLRECSLVKKEVVEDLVKGSFHVQPTESGKTKGDLIDMLNNFTPRFEMNKESENENTITQHIDDV